MDGFDFLLKKKVDLLNGALIITKDMWEWVDQHKYVGDDLRRREKLDLLLKVMDAMMERIKQ
jgi:hypothetical protein